MPSDSSSPSPTPDAEKAVPAEATYESFGHFVLTRKIGQGGMAEIWKATATGALGWKRVVVVKRMNTAQAEHQALVDMFCDEARICALLNHPNLVQIHEFGVIGGRYFMAMEYLPGRDLARVTAALRRRGRTMPASVAAGCVLAVARGLAHAHELTDANKGPLNIIHRDVSPSNIMMLYSGDTKLIDFGIARVDEESRQNVTQGRALKGKMSYMAPEQVTGGALDARSDVFCLGTVLWELLTAKYLFRGDNDVESLRNVLHKNIVKPSSLVPNVSPDLDRIALKALERNPQDRYQSATHMARDIEALAPHDAGHRELASDLLWELFGPPPAGDSIPGGVSAVPRLGQNLPLTPSPELSAPTKNFAAGDSDSYDPPTIVDIKPTAKPDVALALEAQAEPELKPGAKLDPRPDANPQAKPDTGAGAKPDVKLAIPSPKRINPRWAAAAVLGLMSLGGLGVVRVGKRRAPRLTPARADVAVGEPRASTPTATTHNAPNEPEPTDHNASTAVVPEASNDAKEGEGVAHTFGARPKAERRARGARPTPPRASDGNGRSLTLVDPFSGVTRPMAGSAAPAIGRAPSQRARASP